MTGVAQSVQGRVLIRGRAEGVALVLEQSLSFWGGFDPLSGQIIDVHHPQYGEFVTASILCIPESHGSAGTPGGIAETLRLGSGPKAFILGKADINISIGALVANRLYDLQVPVIAITLQQMRQLKTASVISINETGLLSIVD